mmetsp:Transcript_31045/g.38347  ORF Transcript_31045/g.38347 Transcript_31045/m.38347 type:complete len:89 (-) Transcript_31045:1267-1533(-)
MNSLKPTTYPLSADVKKVVKIALAGINEKFQPTPTIRMPVVYMARDLSTRNSNEPNKSTRNPNIINRYGPVFATKWPVNKEGTNIPSM